MKLLYLSLFLLQISISLSSLSTFNKVNTNQKAIKISQNFITCLKISTLIPEQYLKQIESMNTLPITNIDDSLLSHSFNRKEIVNIRYVINNCTDYLGDKEKHAYREGYSVCSPSKLTECLLPYIDREDDKNE